MARIVYGILLFGIPANLPPLPEGWVYVTDPKDWLKATAPDGSRHFISRANAYPIVERADMENPIPLPLTPSAPHPLSPP